VVINIQQSTLTKVQGKTVIISENLHKKNNNKNATKQAKFSQRVSKIVPAFTRTPKLFWITHKYNCWSKNIISS